MEIIKKMRLGSWACSTVGKMTNRDYDIKHLAEIQGALPFRNLGCGKKSNIKIDLKET